MSDAADWQVLGLDPTDDAEAVKRAYRARLKTAGPDRDPEGFQRLRAAYESVLAGLETPRPAAPPEPRGEEVAATLLARVNAHRAAGDEAGAIGAVDEALAAIPPGSPEHDAIEDALLDGIALSRSLSPGLFRHLVARFDWTDANGRTARADPERQSIIASRLAAETWWAGLRDSPDPLARALAAPSAAAARALLPPDGLDAEGRARVRELFEEASSHAMFVEHRQNAGALATLREAVEGPPLLGSIPPNRPAGPWALPAGTPATPAAGPSRRQISWGAVIGIGALAGLGAVIPGVLRDSGPRLPDATEARRRLEAADQPWLLLHMEPGGTRVDFSPLVPLRRAITDLRIGVNVEEPGTLMQLPDNGTVPGFMAPQGVRFITVRLRFPDGSISPVRRYDLPLVKR